MNVSLISTVRVLALAGPVPNMMLNLRETGLDTPQARRVRSDLYGLVVPFLVLACLCLSARMYVRIKARKYGIEDWCLVAGLVRRQNPMTYRIILTWCFSSLCS